MRKLGLWPRFTCLSLLYQSGAFGEGLSDFHGHSCSCWGFSTFGIVLMVQESASLYERRHEAPYSSGHLNWKGYLFSRSKMYSRIPNIALLYPLQFISYTALCCICAQFWYIHIVIKQTCILCLLCARYHAKQRAEDSMMNTAATITALMEPEGHYPDNDAKL